MDKRYLCTMNYFRKCGDYPHHWAHKNLNSKRAIDFLIFDFIVKAKAICTTLNTVGLSSERNVVGLKAQTRLRREQLKVG